MAQSPVPVTPPAVDDPLTRECRLFYERRLKVAESLREGKTPPPRLRPPDPSEYQVGAGIDNAMKHLRQEMATLITQDNALFHQLLTLNDSIEELKEQQRCLADSRSSSLDSLSDTEVADQSASPTSTLSSSSSSSSSGVDIRPRFFLSPATFIRGGVSIPPSRTRRAKCCSFRQEDSPRLGLVAGGGVMKAQTFCGGRLVLTRYSPDTYHLTTHEGNAYDSGFHGSESDAEIFV